MNDDISRTVLAVCNDLGLELRSYSGRECVGVVTQNPFQDLSRILFALAGKGADGLLAAEHFTRDGAVQSDSMGGEDILYFPRLPWQN